MLSMAEEGENTKGLTQHGKKRWDKPFSMSIATHGKLKKIAEVEDRPMSWIIDRLVDLHFKELKLSNSSNKVGNDNTGAEVRRRK